MNYLDVLILNLQESNNNSENKSIDLSSECHLVQKYGRSGLMKNSGDNLSLHSHSGQTRDRVKMPPAYRNGQVGH